MSERAERLRLFLAVAVPDDILTRLATAIEPHRSAVGGARWAPVENQHVTLKFLGSVASERSSQIERACREAASTVAAGDIAVAGVGAFPNARRARVLWAGIEDPAGLLADLAARLDERLEPVGFRPEARAFTPHLTLARLKTPAPVHPLLDEVTFRSEAFRVEEFHLFRSRLSPKGARYEILDSYVLRGV